MLNLTEHGILTAHKLLIKTIMLKNKYFSCFHAFKLSDDVFIMLVNVKMPTIFIVGILTFMRRINFVPC